MNVSAARTTVPLGEIVRVISGFSFKSERFSDDGDIPLVRIRDVTRGYSETYYSGEYDDQFLVADGDLLVGMDGEFNRERWRGGRALLNQRVCKLVPDEKNLLPEYLYYFLPQALKKIEDRTPFVTVKHLSSKDIKNIEIPLPPLDEQRRIAAILDKADDLRRKRQYSIDLLSEFTQAVFVSMFSSECRIVEVGSVCSRITDGTHQAPKWSQKGVPFLFVSNIRNQVVSLDTEKFVDSGEYARLTKNAPIEEGDVLYTAVGSYGHSAVVDFEERFVFQRHIAHLKPLRGKIEPRFLAAALESPKVKAQADKVARGVAQKTVTLESLKKIGIPLPPLEQQVAFVQKVELARRSMTRMREMLVRLDALFSSVQTRAFSGRL